MHYVVLEEKNAKDMTNSVNRKIIEGWQLQGGVSVAVKEGFSSFHYVYVQAMIHDESGIKK